MVEASQIRKMPAWTCYVTLSSSENMNITTQHTETVLNTAFSYISIHISHFNWWTNARIRFYGDFSSFFFVNNFDPFGGTGKIWVQSQFDA